MTARLLVLALGLLLSAPCLAQPLSRAQGSEEGPRPSHAAYLRSGFDAALVWGLGYRALLPTALARLHAGVRVELGAPFGDFELRDHFALAEGAAHWTLRGPFELRLGLGLEERRLDNRTFDVVTLGARLRPSLGAFLRRGAIALEGDLSFAPVAWLEPSGWYREFVNADAQSGAYRLSTRNYRLLLRGAALLGPLELGGSAGYAFFGRYDFLPAPVLDLFVAVRWPRAPRR